MSKNIELKEMIIMSIIVGLKHYKVPKELALVLLTTIFVYFLTSCSKTSYELFYEY